MKRPYDLFQAEKAGKHRVTFTHTYTRKVSATLTVASDINNFLSADRQTGLRGMSQQTEKAYPQDAHRQHTDSHGAVL